MIEVLFPNRSDVGWEGHLRVVAAQSSIRPFSPLLIRFVETVSRLILRERSMRRYPELLAMAHWMRGAHLAELHRGFERRLQGSTLLPRGVVLHFAPSNVDSIFIYSWFLSLLVGNANVIRLSQRRGEQMTDLLGVLVSVLSREEFIDLFRRTLILSYEHDDATTAALSDHCQVRVIWGGDETIRRIRQVPLPSLATEIAFADRFSLAALQARAVDGAEETQFENLIRAFYNDSFWFDQMACSSPRLVVWIGDEMDIARAKTRFWEALRSYVQTKATSAPAVVMTRVATVYHYATMPGVDSVPGSPTEAPCRVHVQRLDADAREMHCGAGLFLETELPMLSDLPSLLSPKDQTLTVFGFTKEEVRILLGSINGRALDRIVPVGQALNFSPVWDGNDLFRSFTRELEISA